MRATLILLLVLSGCVQTPMAPPQPVTWTRLTPTADALDVAFAKCQMQQAQLPPPAESTDHSASGNLYAASDYAADGEMRRRFVSNCMLASGWRRN